MLIPSFLVDDMAEAIGFYTEILDFEIASAMPAHSPFYAVLTRSSDELHLCLPSGTRVPGHSSMIMVVSDADAVFENLVARGLKVPSRANSPVHAAPLDQTWGTREFYVDDPSGNTVIYQQR